MLIYFKIANYGSIKDEVIINFNATSISEHVQSNVIKLGTSNLLKTVLLYGHNASGKSKILNALVFYRWIITNSATENQGKEPFNIEPFQLSSSTMNNPSFFEASFIIDEVKYRYGFELDREKIHKEWLLETKLKKEYPVFLRINDNFQIDEKRLPNAKDLNKKTRKNALFLSVASQWNVKKAEKINDWFESMYTIHGLLDERYRRITFELLKKNEYVELIKSFIAKADLGINAIDVIDMPVQLDQMIKDVPEELKSFFAEKLKNKQEKTVFTFHSRYDENNKKIEEIPFLLDKDESAGTIKYFNIIGSLVQAIKEDRVIIIDEFDARLHTLLTKAILKLFNSSILKSKAQLIVASHDTALLDRELLRRDQIYFVEKNIYGASEVTSLVEYKPRKDTRYDSNYLEGRYGAIPAIGDLEDLLSNEKKKS